KLDPYNGQAIGLVQSLQGFKKGQAANPAQPTLQQLEKAVQANPNDFQTAFNLAATYMQMQQTGRALQVLDRMLNSPKADASAFRALIAAYASMNNSERVQAVVAKFEAQLRANPENLSAALGAADGYRHLKQN